MKKILNIKNLIDFAYYKYKSKNAVSIEKEYIKNINYFNYRFDIYSLARAINKKINNKQVAIVSENRYEFLVTYLANIILQNTIVIIDSNLSQNVMAKIIRKYNVETIFFSNKDKETILEISKNNLKKKKLNLINFDSNNKFPIIEYEKLINLGGYIENYSIDNIPDADEKIKNIIIANTEGVKEYSQEDFIITAQIIGKNIRVKRRKIFKAEEMSNTFYKIVIKIILPLLYGNCVQYSLNENQNRKYDVEILEESKNKITLEYRTHKYFIENSNTKTYVIKVEDNLLKRKNEKETPNFVLIKSNRKEKVKSNKKSATI